jgi:HK97 family phage portal protein
LPGQLIDQHGNPLVAKQATEGLYRDGPWYLPVTGGFLPAGSAWNFWQLGYDVQGIGASSMVEACISAYAQTIAMCPGDHWFSLATGGRERVTRSDLTRVLRRPNDYQSISDFLLNGVWSLYGTGNMYAIAVRNDRFEVAAMHLMREGTPRVAEDGAIFYELRGNEIVDKITGVPSIMVPSRDVLHIRLKCPRHPLVGETPLVAAALQMAAGNAALGQQIAFYLNQARPSFVLTTDAILNQSQVTELRDAWNAQSQALNAGGTPILTAGLKPHTLSVTSKDAELAALMKLNDEGIANVFRVPLQILGMGGTPFASTEALMQYWKNGGLGFALNHIEEAIGNFFKLRGQPEEYLEFSTSALLRSSQKENIETLAASVRGGLKKINEARSELSLPRVEGGDDIRVQQQDVPLDWHEDQKAAQAAPPPAPPEDGEGEEQEPEPDEDEEDEEDAERDFAEVILAAARRHAEADPA